MLKLSINTENDLDVVFDEEGADRVTVRIMDDDSQMAATSATVEDLRVLCKAYLASTEKNL